MYMCHYHYHLPEERIAIHPPQVRGQSNLLVHAPLSGTGPSGNPLQIAVQDLLHTGAASTAPVTATVCTDLVFTQLADILPANVHLVLQPHVSVTLSTVIGIIPHF